MTSSARRGIKTSAGLSNSFLNLKLNQEINQNPDLGLRSRTKLPPCAVIEEVINRLRPPLVSTEATPLQRACPAGSACSSGGQFSKEPTNYGPLTFSSHTTPIVETSCASSESSGPSEYSWNRQPRSYPWLLCYNGTVPNSPAGIQPVQYSGKFNDKDVSGNEPLSKVLCPSQSEDMATFQSFSNPQTTYLGKNAELIYPTNSHSYVDSYEPRQQVATSERLTPPTEKKQQKIPCDICGRLVTRDFSRHRRIHDRIPRFHCVFPKECCNHKSGYFNRRYDLKKHLLHTHFILDDYKVKRLKTLEQKLEKRGHCLCGQEMTAQEWLDHIVEINENQEPVCPDLAQKCRTVKMKRASIWRLMLADGDNHVSSTWRMRIPH